MIPGTRVWCQHINEDTGRFGKVDKHDTGTVIQDVGYYGYNIFTILAVKWDRGECMPEFPDVDAITDTGRAVEWPYQVLAIRGHDDALLRQGRQPAKTAVITS